MLANQCQATTKDDRPCKAPILPGESWCFNHHPDMVERRRAARVKGGKARSNMARAAKTFSDKPLTTAELIKTLSQAIRQTAAGGMEPNIANSLSGLARAIASIRETAELEERIADLERNAERQSEALGNLRRIG